MVSRHFITFCVLALFATLANVKAEDGSKLPKQVYYSETSFELDDAKIQELANRDIIDEIVKILQEVIVGAAENCLKEAAKQCKKYWIRPKKLIECAKDYFHENQGDCAIPEIPAVYSLETTYELDDAKIQELANRDIIDEIVKILQEVIVGAAENCLKEAAKQCKKYWIRPKKLIECAKDYFHENQGDCAIPEIPAVYSLETTYELDDAKIQELATRNIIDEIVKILQEVIVGAAENCLKEAAKQCKKYWIRPKKLIECAKEYFHENQGDCAIPEIPAVYSLETKYELDDAIIQELANRNIIDEIVKILQEAIVGAAENCLKEAAKQCKKYWIRPKKLIECAKEYFKENQGDCAIPELF